MHIHVGRKLHLLSIFQITSPSFFTRRLLNLRYWTLSPSTALDGPHVHYFSLFVLIVQQCNGYEVDALLQLHSVIYISILLFSFFCLKLRQCLKFLQFDREWEATYLNMKEVVCYLLYGRVNPLLPCVISESFITIQGCCTFQQLDRISDSIVYVSVY